uniref:Xylulose kinase-1 n=1 Tax=Tanacetum cinerariifolium TaxID=118510 RepID=A0A699H010_TANCI|nr:hypothetical protein [Tanacetum cinerariifolium]
MSTPKFAKTHNLVIFLEKPTESEGFEQIIDFSNANPIKYALTVNPTIYTSCIKQFWATTKVKIVNGEQQIQALVDKKKVIIIETSVKSDIHSEDAEEDGVKFLMFSRFVQVFLDSQVEDILIHKEIYVTPSHTKNIFANMKRQGKDFFDEHVTITSNDPLLSGEDKLKLTELMELCTKLQSRVLALETTKADQALEIGSLKRRGRMIEDLDADEGVALVDETQGRNDQGMFDTSILDDEEVVAKEVVAKKEVSTANPVTTAGEVVTTAGVEVTTTGEVVTTAGVEVSAAAITSQISMDEITLAKALVDIKTSKPKAKGIIMKEPSETPTPTPKDTSQQSSKAKDKGKAKKIEPEKPLKRKEQIMIDEEVARILKAQMQAELEEANCKTKERKSQHSFSC